MVEETISSKYYAELDKVSQEQTEKKNLEDKDTDMYLMDEGTFRRQFKGLLNEDAEIYLSSSGNLYDSDRRSYDILFTTAEEPQIVYDQGAFPCSLVATYDSKGNFAVIHLTRYSQFVGTRDSGAADNEQIENLNRFMKDHLQEDSRVVISATNVKTELREKIEQSIRERLDVADEQIDTLYVDGERLYKDGDVPEGSIPPTKDKISSLYFIPRQFTKSGKNALCFVGSAEGQDTDDGTWLITDFDKQYPRRQFSRGKS